MRIPHWAKAEDVVTREDPMDPDEMKKLTPCKGKESIEETVAPTGGKIPCRLGNL